MCVAIYSFQYIFEAIKLYKLHGLSDESSGFKSHMGQKSVWTTNCGTKSDF